MLISDQLSHLTTVLHEAGAHDAAKAVRDARKTWREADSAVMQAYAGVLESE